MFLQLAEGFGAQALVLPERRVGKALRAGDDDAVDMALQAPVRCLEAELHVVRVARAQIEARRAQPACYAVLDHVAALEDA